jgi:hypothetical protein
MFFLCGVRPTSKQLILFSSVSILGAIITTLLYSKPSIPSNVNFLLKWVCRKLRKATKTFAMSVYVPAPPYVRLSALTSTAQVRKIFVKIHIGDFYPNL